MLYREVRWGLMMVFALFAFVFGGIGSGLVVVAFGSSAKHRAKPWSDGKIENSVGSHAFLPAAAAVVCGVISWPVCVAGWHDMAKSGGFDLALFSLLPLAAPVLVAVAAVQWRYSRRFGKLALNLPSGPGEIGGSLDGVIEAPAGQEPPEGFVQ